MPLGTHLCTFAAQMDISVLRSCFYKWVLVVVYPINSNKPPLLNKSPFGFSCPSGWFQTLRICASSWWEESNLDLAAHQVGSRYSGYVQAPDGRNQIKRQLLLVAIKLCFLQNIILFLNFLNICSSSGPILIVELRYPIFSWSLAVGRNRYIVVLCLIVQYQQHYYFSLLI